MLAAVLTREPDWTLLPAGLPPGVATLLRRCLHKDRTQRIRDIGDAWLALDGVFDGAAPPAPQSSVPARPPWKRALPLAAAAVVAALVTGFAAWSRWPARETPAITRFDYVLPEGQQFATTQRPVIATSPDGGSFVYQTNAGLYRRPIGDLEAHLIPGTEECCVRADRVARRPVAGLFLWLGTAQESGDRRRCIDGPVRRDAALRRELDTRPHDPLRSDGRHHARVGRWRHTGNDRSRQKRRADLRRPAAAWRARRVVQRHQQGRAESLGRGAGPRRGIVLAQANRRRRRRQRSPLPEDRSRRVCAARRTLRGPLRRRSTADDGWRGTSRPGHSTARRSGLRRVELQRVRRRHARLRRQGHLVELAHLDESRRHARRHTREHPARAVRRAAPVARRQSCARHPVGRHLGL